MRKRTSKLRNVRGSLLILSISLFQANAVLGNTTSWAGGNGDFITPSNWTPIYPSPTTNWVINGGTAYNTQSYAIFTFYSDGYIAFGEDSHGGLYNDMVDGVFSIQHLFVGHSGSGTLHHYNGTFSVHQETHIGHEANSFGQLVISGTGAKWKADDGILTVGYLGTGKILIENGGSLDSGAARLAANVGSNGEAVVTGSGSRWNSGSLIVGSTGYGTLTIENQGQVSIGENLSIGQSPNSSGIVTATGEGSTLTVNEILEITGNGSTLISELGATVRGNLHFHIATNPDDIVSVVVNNGTLTTKSLLYLGYWGNASMTVSEGGSVQAMLIRIGDSGTATGTLQVSGSNSEVKATISLVVGADAKGIVDISTGAKVLAQQATVADLSAGSGTITVRGTGTQFETEQHLQVGVRGEGSLNVLEGAKVKVGSSFATNVHESGTGTTLVDGEGSRLDIYTDFYLGYHGYGQATISNGATASVGVQLIIGYGESGHGTLNLAEGGTLEVGGVNGIYQREGNATLNFSGGTLRVIKSNLTTSVPINLSAVSTIDTGDRNATLSGALSGTGGLVKTGAGTLILTASSSYTGKTFIRSGALSLQENGEIGKGDLVIENGIFDVSQSAAPVYHFDEKTLRGQGVIIATDKFFSLGGTYESGDERGTLTVLGNLSLKETALIKLSIDSALAGAFDRIVVDGTLTFSGTLQLTTNYTPSIGDVIQLFEAESYSDTFDAIEGIDLGSGYYWDTSNLHVNGTIVVATIPEPSGLPAAILMGSAYLIFRRKRLSWRATAGVRKQAAFR